MITLRKYLLTLAGFLALALLTVLIAPAFGSVRLDPLPAFREWLGAPRASMSAAATMLDLRLIRIVLAFLTGGTLALAGAVFQALLRNPLATPFTLGISGGSSLGAVIAIYLAKTQFGYLSIPNLAFSWGVISGVQLFALIGGLSAVSLIYLLGRRQTRLSTVGLLLAGVTINLICSAGILVIRYLASPQLLMSMERWLMGGLDAGSWRAIVPILPLLVPGVAVLLYHSRAYDQLAFGEELAAGRGVNAARLQKISLGCGSLATAAVVAACGPIGFVGLLVPHVLRGLIGPGHQLLLPCCFLAGGAFLVACDTIARTIIPGVELPVGILTALLGGPFFLFLLIRSGGSWRVN